jgi:hypothetical protein
MVGLIPVIRLQEGKYLVGSEVKAMQIKADTLLVRVGGGYTTLEEHIEKVARYECLKINQIMRKQQLDFKAAVCTLLDKHKANVKVKNGFVNGDNCTVDAFNSTMKVLEARAETTNERRKSIKQLKTDASGMQKKLMAEAALAGGSLKGKSPRQNSPGGTGKTGVKSPRTVTSPRGTGKKSPGRTKSPK